MTDYQQDRHCIDASVRDKWPLDRYGLFVKYMVVMDYFLSGRLLVGLTLSDDRLARLWYSMKTGELVGWGEDGIEGLFDLAVLKRIRELAYADQSDSNHIDAGPDTLTELVLAKPRDAVVRFIEDQMRQEGMGVPGKHGAWHYGRQELRALLDYMYSGPPAAQDEELPKRFGFDEDEENGENK